LQAQALAILRRPGITANVYGAGIGAINALQAGNYTLSDGSTGLSAVDGSAGLVLDGAGSLGSELSTVMAASFSARNGNECLSANSVSANLTYLVTYDYNISVGTVQANIGNIANVSKTGVGTATVICTPTSGGAIAIGCNAATGSVSNFTVKQVTGIHATQSTAGNRPTPRRGLLNRLLYSQDFSNAAWTKSNGSAAANSFTENSGAGTHECNNTTGGTAVVGTTYTAQIKVKANGRTRIRIQYNGGAFTATALCYFDLANGTFDNLGTAGINPRITPIGGGEYLIALSATATSAAALLVYFTLASTGTTVSYTGDGVSGVLMRDAQLETGSIASDYSPTTSAAASNPAAGRYSWGFDGATDYLDQGSVPFQQADDRAVIVAFNAQAAGIIYDVSAATGNPLLGRIQIDAAGTIFCYFRDDATTLVTMSYAAALNTPYVVSYRVVAGVRVLRVNGVQRATNSTVLGTTTVTIARIGAAATTTPAGFSLAAISQLLPLKGTFTDADMLVLERECASTLPNGPTF